MKRKIAYVIGLILAFVMALVVFHKVFSFKYGDGIYGLTCFYELEKDSVDVVVLGSSHAFENVNPMVIWEDTGIAVFDLCGSVAPMWSSYYYLKEALKTQSPKLVVLEGYCLTGDFEYLDTDRIIKNLNGLKFSLNKMEALQVSAPKERWLEFGLEYIWSHKRYRYLSSADYKKYQDNEPLYSSWKGFGNNFSITPYENPQIVNDGSMAALPEKQKKYYEMILDLCKKEDIELLVMLVPYSGYTYEDMAVFNAAKDIADKQGVSFYNFNDCCDEIGIDWTTDFADTMHMSYLGNEKFSRYLGQFLLEHYEWEPHTNDTAKYESWDRALHYYQNSLRNHALPDIENLNDYATVMNDLMADQTDYTILVSVKGWLPGSNKTLGIRHLMELWGIPNDDAYKDRAWVVNEEGVQMVVESDYGYYWADRFGDKELLIDKNGIYWDRINYEKTQEGINMVIFDENNQVVVDAFGIEYDSIIR